MEMDDLRRELLGKTVSVLMEGLKGKEAYVGVMTYLDEDWIILDMPGGKYDKHYVRARAVISILRRIAPYKPE